tara:strand:- start:45 stop:338 length:294 start_codon:yes stop_codon:yes gene_type:complete
MNNEIKDIEYWKNNAKEDYIKTPISVLRYITELEKRMPLVQKLPIDLVSKPLQADIRNKLSPLSNLIAMLEDGADDEWLEKQVVECKKSIEYLSNVC